MRVLVLAAVAGCAHAPPPTCTLPLAMGGSVGLGEHLRAPRPDELAQIHPQLVDFAAPRPLYP